jgi:hypothetical protein
MNPNQASWTTPRHRAPCAAAAVLASTAVLSSVLWLFAGAVPGDAAIDAATALAARHPVTVAGIQKTSRRVDAAGPAGVKL